MGEVHTIPEPLRRPEHVEMVTCTERSAPPPPRTAHAPTPHPLLLLTPYAGTTTHAAVSRHNAIVWAPKDEGSFPPREHGACREL